MPLQLDGHGRPGAQTPIGPVLEGVPKGGRRPEMDRFVEHTNLESPSDP